MILLLIGAVIFHVVVLLMFLHYSRRSAEALENLADVTERMFDYEVGRSHVPRGDGSPPPEVAVRLPGGEIKRATRRRVSASCEPPPVVPTKTLR